MKTIYKYPLPIVDSAIFVDMPYGATILTVQMQGDQACIWAHVDSQAPPQRRIFRVYGTGHSVTHTGRYIGTVQQAGGALVWHVFEAKP